MPIIIFPLIFIFSITIIEIKAPAPHKSNGFETSPNLNIVSFPDGTCRPIKLKPITAKNKPIPAPIPSFKLFGI